MQRTGSFPLMNIADDFGLPYGDVLLFADSRWRTESERTPHHRGAIHRIYATTGVEGIVNLQKAVAAVARSDRR
jgi:hypothetical protein